MNDIKEILSPVAFKEISVTLSRNGSISLSKRLDDNPLGMAIGIVIGCDVSNEELGLQVKELLSKK